MTHPNHTVSVLLQHLGVLPNGHLDQLRRWNPLLPELPALALTSSETLGALEELLQQEQSAFRVEEHELVKAFLAAVKTPGNWRLCLRQGDEQEEVSSPIVITRDGEHAALAYMEEDGALWNGESFITNGTERCYLGEGKPIYLDGEPVLRKYPIQTRQVEVAA